MLTLCQFANQRKLETILIKERAKCCRKNDGGLIVPDADGGIPADLISRKQLSLLMPPRCGWVRPKNRKPYLQPDGKLDVKKYNARCIALSIKRDRTLKAAGSTDPKLAYLDRLDRYCADLRRELQSGRLELQSPSLKPLEKSREEKDGVEHIVYRPLSIYTSLHDKVILSVGSRYLASCFGRYLHDNILSYRAARDFGGQSNVVTDFNDGIRLISRFREAHPDQPLYAADCDIRKFYDGIPHDVVRSCFSRLLSADRISEVGKRQVMNLLEAYLRSYNFRQCVMEPSEEQDFWKCVRSSGSGNLPTRRSFDWLPEADKLPYDEQCRIGVPQGGSLSLMIADVVLNDVDLEAGLVRPDDPDMLFIRFCDDMVLLHTDRAECDRLMRAYARSLESHRLYYHPFRPLSDFKQGQLTTAGFWHAKSHEVFRWADGDEATGRIGFLGYEMKRDGTMRLRKSNIHKLYDKIDRTRSAVLRCYWPKKGKPDYRDFAELTRKRFRSLASSLVYYEGLRDQPLDPGQMRRLEERRLQMIRRLAALMKRKQRDLTDQEREAFARCILRYAVDPSYALLPPGAAAAIELTR